MEAVPELPIELWHHITAALVVVPSDTNYGPYIDSDPYWALIRTASAFECPSPMRATLIRTFDDTFIKWTKLPNGAYHSVNDKPAICKQNGTLQWYQNGQLHRDSGPAIVYMLSAGEEWYQNGYRHRDDGPAITDYYGTKMWFQRGMNHRDNSPTGESLPAVVSANVPNRNGAVKYFQHGKLHRDNSPTGDSLPAVIYEDGTQKWYQQGKLHRMGAPAVVYNDGKSVEWWRSGVRTIATWWGISDIQPLEYISDLNIDGRPDTKMLAEDCICTIAGQDIRTNGIRLHRCDCVCDNTVIHHDESTYARPGTVGYQL